MDDVESSRTQGATVYILQSVAAPHRRYIGLTTWRLGARVREHNGGHIPSTKRWRPWRVHAAFWFPERKTAAHFERYLKSGSGQAFATRHFPLPLQRTMQVHR